jgi:hypothetical protein
VRLTSLLEIYRGIRGSQRNAAGNVERYFSIDKRDGAEIFDGSIVVRFEMRGKRGAYSVLGVEIDSDRSEVGKDMASGTMKVTMQRFETERLPIKKQTSPSYYCLINYLYQR